MAYSDDKVANRWGFGWEMSSRGRFATPADSPRHDCSPYSHVRRESLGSGPRSRTIFPAPCAMPNHCVTIRHFFNAGTGWAMAVQRARVPAHAAGTHGARCVGQEARQLCADRVGLAVGSHGRQPRHAEREMPSHGAPNHRATSGELFPSRPNSSRGSTGLMRLHRACFLR
jgi:hypothetical protein